MADLNAVFTVCGIAQQPVRALIMANEGFVDIDDLGVMEGDKDVLEMAKRLSSRTVADGRVLLGTVQIKRLQALVWWVRDHHRRGLVIDHNDFNVISMNVALTSKGVERDRGDG